MIAGLCWLVGTRRCDRYQALYQSLAAGAAPVPSSQPQLTQMDIVVKDGSEDLTPATSLR